MVREVIDIVVDCVFFNVDIGKIKLVEFDLDI